MSCSRPKRAGVFLSAVFWGQVVTWLTIGFVDHKAEAGDWPQILGPHRNGIASEETLADAWPKPGPRTVWDVPVGKGFAGVVVSGKRVILFHRMGDEDTFSSFDADTGEALWSTGFATDFEPAIVDDDGPRAVPTIDQDRIYGLAAAGGLFCVDLQQGNLRWQRQIQKEFRAPAGYFGSGTSPLVEGNLVIVNVGGDKDRAGIVAFHRDTGETVWKASNELASYSSPVAATLDGKRILLCLTRFHLVSIDPATGKEMARLPFGQRGPTVNAAIPVIVDHRVLLTASYGIGSELHQISPAEFKPIWKDDLLSSQYTTPIVYGGKIFGIDGRQDGGPIALKCFDTESRQIHWTKSGLAYATLIAADEKLIVVQTAGVVRLVTMIESGYHELAMAKVMSGTTRALPALAHGRLYIRNERQLKCLALTE